MNTKDAIKEKVHYYLNTLSYLPRKGRAYEALRRRILPEEGLAIFDDIDAGKIPADIYLMTYLLLCGQEKAPQPPYYREAIDILASLADNNPDAAYIVSQMRHSMANGIFIQVDQTASYTELMREILISGRYKEHLDEVSKYLKLAASPETPKKGNKYAQWIYAQDLRKSGGGKEDEDKISELLASAAGMENIANGIFHTGHPTAEFIMSNHMKHDPHQNPEKIALSENLLISSSRIYYQLHGNPKIYTGNPQAAWILYNKMLREDMPVFGHLPTSDVMDLALLSAARLDEMEYYDEFGLYRGSIQAAKTLLRRHHPKTKYLKQEINFFAHKIKEMARNSR
jgi:hypothetical protein